jgi:hypothetical protein
MTAFWKALVIIGGYGWELCVFLGPILYENAIIPLIKRNFGFILTVYPQILIFEPISKSIGTGAYLMIYFIGNYIIKNILNILIFFLEILIIVLTKMAEGIVWVAKKIGIVLSFIYKYTGGLLLRGLFAFLDFVESFAKKGRI